MNKKQISFIIKQLRFPLAVMVVFIHLGQRPTNFVTEGVSVGITCYIYNAITYLIPHVICQVAVPLFFLFSGYLFFQQLEIWNWDIWKNKIRRRVHTLLIPYVIWNIIRYVFDAVCQYTAILQEGDGFNEFLLWLHNNTSLMMLWHNSWAGAGGYISWLGTPISISVPIHVAFWFIRNLMVMIALTPLIYYIVKRFGNWIVLILGLAYISSIWPTFPGQSICTVFFFTFGSCLSIRNVDVMKLLSKCNSTVLFTPTILIAVILVFAKDFVWIRSIFLPIFVLFAILSVVILTNIIIEKSSFRICDFLADSTFFIYAFHMFIHLFINVIIGNIPMVIPDNICLSLMIYFLYPLSAIGVCLVFYWFLRHYFSPLCKVVLGK